MDCRSTYFGLYRDIIGIFKGNYIGEILGEWKRKWKLLLARVLGVREGQLLLSSVLRAVSFPRASGLSMASKNSSAKWGFPN